MRKIRLRSLFLVIVSFFVVYLQVRNKPKLLNTDLSTSFKGYKVKRNEESQDDFLLLTVANKKSIALDKLLRSAKLSGVNVKVLGLDEPWKGLGDKVWLVKQELEQYKDDSSKLILFADGYDVLINDNITNILEKFYRSRFQILFAAEHNTWTGLTGCPEFPNVERGKRCLNSGLFIGYASQLYDLVKNTPFPVDNDQKYYSHLYVDEKIRRQFNIGLDHRCEIFQTFESDRNHVDLLYRGKEIIVHNRDYDTYPSIVHTPGFFKPYISSFRNFLPSVWTPREGCITCLEDTTDLSKLKTEDYPVVLVTVFVEAFSSQLEAFFTKLFALNYPKKKIHLLIHNFVDQHGQLIQNRLERHKSEYNSTQLVQHLGRTFPEGQYQAKTLSLKSCQATDCDFYFSLDSIAHIDNPLTLRLLIEQNRPVVGPILFGPQRKTTNFSDYVQLGTLVRYNNTDGNEFVAKRRGLWSVSVVSSCYLMKADVARKYSTEQTVNITPGQDFDVALSIALNNDEIETLVSNRVDFGHLVQPGKMACSELSCKIF